MTFKFTPKTASSLLTSFASLAAVTATVAHAAIGFTVTPQQETQIAPGMTTAQVQSLLGAPAKGIRYGNEPGPTWTYGVTGVKDTLFDVDFGADGKVASIGERWDEISAHR